MALFGSSAHPEASSAEGPFALHHGKAHQYPEIHDVLHSRSGAARLTRLPQLCSVGIAGRLQHIERFTHASKVMLADGTSLSIFITIYLMPNESPSRLQNQSE